eukprot:3513976-Lingulodinium_polyedra.AAC.1
MPKGARAPRANAAWTLFDTAALRGRGALLSGKDGVTHLTRVLRAGRRAHCAFQARSTDGG